jgi:Bacterial HORMA domain family 1
MSSYTESASVTFTITHARHLAAKIATDLKRLQRLYGSPSDASISDYEAEAVELMRLGYLECITYGFRRNGNWIEPALRYTAKEIATAGIDDDPGRVRPNMDVSGATFYSYLTRTAAWQKLSDAEKEALDARMPYKRVGAPEPQVEGGYFAEDKTYSAGGRSLNRASVRSY